MSSNCLFQMFYFPHLAERYFNDFVWRGKQWVKHSIVNGWWVNWDTHSSSFYPLFCCIKPSSVTFRADWKWSGGWVKWNGKIIDRNDESLTRAGCNNMDHLLSLGVMSGWRRVGSRSHWSWSGSDTVYLDYDQRQHWELGKTVDIVTCVPLILSQNKTFLECSWIVFTKTPRVEMSFHCIIVQPNTAESSKHWWDWS